MRRRLCNPVEVFVNSDDAITIAQQCGLLEPSLISVTADQVDLLIQWLQEAKDELQEEKEG